VGESADKETVGRMGRDCAASRADCGAEIILYEKHWMRFEKW
jgi:hypothetical protein